MSTRGARFAEVDVAELRFTHARVRPFFSGCGRRLEATLSAILSGELTLDAVPIITVLPNTAADGTQYYFSLNNRRLWVYKQLHDSGYFDNGKKLRVRIKEPLPREKERYTPERCSMTARIMKEGGGGAATEGTAADDSDDEKTEAGAGAGAEADTEAETGAKEVVTVLGQLLVAARITTASDEAATTAVPAQAPAPVGNVTKNKSNNGTRKAAPAPAPAPAPLTAEMLKSLKALAAQWKKAKGNKNTERKIQSQLDEWIDDGACAAEREEEIWAIIRR